MALTLARETARDAGVSCRKRYVPPEVAGNPEQDFAEARTRLDHDDPAGALVALDRARKGFSRRGDVEGLEHVLALAALVEPDAERAAAARANLEYATKQNLRQTTRRAALAARAPWSDPYPDLESPAVHTRVPITRKIKIAVGIGVLIAVLLIAAYIVAIVVFASSTTTTGVVVVNDLQRKVEVRWCDDDDCDLEYESHDLFPRGSTEIDMDADDVLDMLVVRADGRRLGCLPVRVSAVYNSPAEDPDALKVRLSQMTPCPGEPIVPEAIYEASAA
jgi:hypothetical protein